MRITIDILLTIVAFISSVFVWIRFRKYLRRSPVRKSSCDGAQRISVIVPVRNEEANIPSLLSALCKSGAYEIIVVDDQSTDRTCALVETFPVRLVHAGVRPEGWVGKTWACHVGSKHAMGALLLFTDADTVHYEGGLSRAVTFMRSAGADMVSAPAYHLNRHWWERLLGPFHCLIHAGVSPYDSTAGGSAYALGQFLLIRADVYRAIGGHSSVRNALAEDAAMAGRVLKASGRYRMYTGPKVFGVQMYSSFGDFLSGWTRLMRLGLGLFNVHAIAYSLIPLFALNAFNLSSLLWIHWIPVFITLACFAFVQGRVGRFSIAGVILFPLSVILFLGIALYASLLEWLKQPFAWRGRLYPAR